MLYIKFIILCVNILFVFAQSDTKNPLKSSDKTAEEKTYVIEPSDDPESEATTIIPPLVEGEPMPVSFLLLISKSVFVFV